MLYEYLCQEHGRFEALCSLQDREIPKSCPQCFKPSRFVLSAPSITLEGITGDFPTAYSKWDRLRQSRLKAERKRSV